MKSAALLSSALLAVAQPSAAAVRLAPDDFRTPSHPRVYFTQADLPRLRKKAEKVAWAADFVREAHKLVDRHVERHAGDPSFAVSRLQMHWEEGRRHTSFRTDGNFIPRREGNARYPTIRPAYARSWGNGVKTGDWEDEKPYSDGTLHARDGSPVPFEQTGQAYENINGHFLRMAYSAAILYSLEGDASYAKFAADIVWTLVRGGAQQKQVNPDDSGGNNGFLSWETLGDTRHYWAIPLVWDMLYGYFHETYFDTAEFKKGIAGELWAPGHPEGREWALEQFHVFFEKMIDNKLERGGGLIGNWNLNEQQSAMLYALALDDDAAYADGRGREYYVKRLVYGPTGEHHGAYADVLRANIEESTGLWPEAPGGYGQGSIAQLVKFGFIYWKNGLDLLSSDPLLEKASQALPQMAFPNGYVTNVGDSSYHRIWSEQLELMLVYSLAKKDKTSFIRAASLLNSLGRRDTRGDFAFFFYLPGVPDVPPPKPSLVSYAPCYPSVLMRNGTNATEALSFALSASSTKMGHRHANGLNLEFCGLGEVLAPDPGAGKDYWSRDTHEYYRHVAGHNTVTPNGLGADDGIDMPFTSLVSEPEAVPGGAATESVSPYRQFVQAESAFRHRNGFDCRQQRTVGIVRTSRAGGYYIDVFRSRVKSGEEKYHDYIFHLLGEWDDWSGNGEKDGGKLDPESGKGYGYFATLDRWTGGRRRDGIVDYGGGVKTGVHLATAPGDEIYRLEGPKVFRHYNRNVSEKPCPAFIVRRKGEAWRRPFAAVYEPYGRGVSRTVDHIECERVKGDPDGVKVTVFMTDPSRKDVVTVSSSKPFTVVSFKDGKVVDTYAPDVFAKPKGVKK